MEEKNSPKGEKLGDQKGLEEKDKYQQNNENARLALAGVIIISIIWLLSYLVFNK